MGSRLPFGSTSNGKEKAPRGGHGAFPVESKHRVVEGPHFRRGAETALLILKTPGASLSSAIPGWPLALRDNSVYPVGFCSCSGAIRGTKLEHRTVMQRGASMLFMVIERFRNRDPKPTYRRLRDQGVIPGAGRPRRKSGSHRIRGWRKPDSNLWSRITRTSLKPLYSPDFPPTEEVASARSETRATWLPGHFG